MPSAPSSAVGTVLCCFPVLLPTQRQCQGQGSRLRKGPHGELQPQAKSWRAPEGWASDFLCSWFPPYTDVDLLYYIKYHILDIKPCNQSTKVSRGCINNKLKGLNKFSHYLNSKALPFSDCYLVNIARMVSHFSSVQPFETLWTRDHQTPLSVGIL